MEAQQAAIKVRNALKQRCRTDLLFLSNNILGYKDVSYAVHGPIIDALPKLLGGEEAEQGYKPFKEIWQLEGTRSFLFLYPRGHLKTTLISQAHLIQWIINYPDIRILLSCATGDQIEKVVRAIKGVFQYNDNFRAVFPEFCPEKADDFGSKDQFIVPARKLTRGEPTLFSVTVGKTIAGYHPDVIFHSDLVDKENIKTPGGLNDVISHFQYMDPLLERYSSRDGYPATRGFTFVEGTPYDFGDLHNLISQDKEGKYAHWVKVIRPAQEDYPHGKILWPERFPPEELERIRKENNDWMFSAQYLMKCVPDGDGLCDPRDVAFVPGEVMRALVPRLRLQCVIDLAGMEATKKGDFTVLTIGGFDTDGRPYIPEIHCRKFSPEEVINLMFSIKARYPQLICFKIEKDAHARVLLPFLQREMSKRQTWLTVVELKRDNHTSKQHRIRGLRPWFKNSLIRFSADIPVSVKTELLDEIAQFPSESAGVHDDILDTLADLMQDGDNGFNIDVVADPPDLKTAFFGQPQPKPRFMGFDENGIGMWTDGYTDRAAPTGEYLPTGVM